MKSLARQAPIPSALTGIVIIGVDSLSKYCMHWPGLLFSRGEQLQLYHLATHLLILSMVDVSLDRVSHVYTAIACGDE